jgi:hypothetical protein
MAPYHRISLLGPLLIGLAATAATVLVHGLIVVVVVRRVLYDLRKGYVGHSFLANFGLVTIATLFTLAGHLVEMALWAWVFVLCGEFSDFAAAFYHSAVNYTTLGYGDVVMSTNWKFLGPLEASDGMLMFGVSTALLFAVIQRLIQTRLGLSDD